MLGDIEPHQVDENNTNETLPCGGWYATWWMKITLMRHYLDVGGMPPSG